MRTAGRHPRPAVPPGADTVRSMNRSLTVVLVVALLLGACASPVAPLPATAVPVASGETRAAAAGWHDGRGWMAQHEDCVAHARDAYLDVVFLGDSITQSWGGPGRRVGSPAADVWERWYGGRRAAAFGISGDRTQHVLWRLDHGLLEHLDPKLVVLMIGTNNVPHDGPADIARGIEAIVARLQGGTDARVLVVPPFRGVQPDTADRLAVDAVADALRLPDDVAILDLGAALSLDDGSYDPELVAGDGIHLRVAGYERWAQRLEPHVAMVLALPLAGSGEQP